MIQHHESLCEREKELSIVVKCQTGHYDMFCSINDLKYF